MVQAMASDTSAEIVAGGLTAGQLHDVVAAAGGGRLDPTSVVVSDVDYVFGSPATAALHRVSGTDADGRGWSLFCKVIQDARHWPQLGNLPPEAAARLVNDYPWRQELDLWDPDVRAAMPPGIRPPQLHRVVDLGEDRLALWMEDVRCVSTPWDLSRYAAAAYLLGRWNQRARDAQLLAAIGRDPHFPLVVFTHNTLPARGLAPLADDELWAHPWLQPHSALRAALRGLAARLDDLLAALHTMALCRPHGDACPQNLLVPTDAPDSFVAIDISQQAPTALGCELGQLAVGLVHANVMPPTALPEIVATILPAYLAGLRQDGHTGSDHDIERAMWTSLLIRSGFDSLPYHLLAGEPTGRNARGFATRVALTSFIVAGATATL
jgi:hypothetical protein